MLGEREAEGEHAHARRRPLETHVKLKFDRRTLQNVLPENDGDLLFVKRVNPWKSARADGVGFTDPFVWQQLRVPPYAPVAPGPQGQRVVNTLKPVPLEFTYMDVGVWGDGLPKDGHRNPIDRRRDFGLVWGEWAAVCHFNTAGAGPTKVSDARQDNPLNAVLDSLNSVGKAEIDRDMFTPARPGLRVDDSTIYAILPDLHLPIATSVPPFVVKTDFLGNSYVDPPMPAWGRYNFNGNRGHAPWPQNIDSWYAKYFAGDIFGNADHDLSKFVIGLARTKLPEGMKLVCVQVGDMYDLWIGLERFFERESLQIVRLQKRDQHPQLPCAFINHWVDETNQIFSTMMKSFSYLKHTRWLWGNHDNYLANTAIITGDDGKDEPAACWLNTVGGDRERCVREGGIYIEHGHRSDWFNCDGAISGAMITNEVFDSPWLRSLDSIRREVRVECAAISFARGADFCVYAMGHT
ncbi:MAG: hypothetical protein ACRCZF_14090, partial [Gemmataceae bacterium]